MFFFRPVFLFMAVGAFCVELWSFYCSTYLRIQGGHFLKTALNLDLTLPDDGECPALLTSCTIIDFGASCVELWSFFVSKRISVPMSYISLWEHTMLRDWWKNDQIGTKMSPASRSRHPGSPPGPPPGFSCEVP